MVLFLPSDVQVLSLESAFNSGFLLQFGTGFYNNYAMPCTFPTAFTNTWYTIVACSQWVLDDNSSISIGELFEYRSVTSTLFRSWHPGGPNIRWISVGY